MTEDINVLIKELDCENCNNFYTCDNNWSEDNLKQCALEKINKKDSNRWIKEIQNYININDKHVSKLALGYLFQSLRNKEDINRFKWRDGTCGH